MHLVLGLDFISVDNITAVPIPKYNNKLKNAEMFDADTKAQIPMKILRPTSLHGNY